MTHACPFWDLTVKMDQEYLPTELVTIGMLHWFQVFADLWTSLGSWLCNLYPFSSDLRDSRIRLQYMFKINVYPHIFCIVVFFAFSTSILRIFVPQIFKHSSEWASVLQFFHFVAPTLGLPDAELAYLSPPALELGVLLPQKSVLLASIINGILKPASSRQSLKKVTWKESTAPNLDFCRSTLPKKLLAGVKAIGLQARI